MPWPWGSRKRFSSRLVYALLILLFSDSQVLAFDESRLWLPSKYHKLYLELKESAAAAEELDNCTEVLQGTIDLDQSMPEHPIFRILCRRPDGLSYNEMVDGLSKETLTTYIPPVVVMSEEDLERQRIEEQLRLEAEKERLKQEFRALCRARMEEKTQLMISLNHLTAKDVEPSQYDGDSAQFNFDFDAKDIAGKALHYRARCLIDEDRQPKLFIGARKE